MTEEEKKNKLMQDLFEWELYGRQKLLDECSLGHYFKTIGGGERIMEENKKSILNPTHRKLIEHIKQLKYKPYYEEIDQQIDSMSMRRTKTLNCPDITPHIDNDNIIYVLIHKDTPTDYESYLLSSFDTTIFHYKYQQKEELVLLRKYAIQLTRQYKGKNIIEKRTKEDGYYIQYGIGHLLSRTKGEQVQTIGFVNLADGKYGGVKEYRFDDVPLEKYDPLDIDYQERLR